ncbi:unnamed protein product [Effrenium voratum]|uniref:Uncharacterized protein n=1 Tax=Effrenium voratum TaxID=2562239 RepID=A0AA36JBD5_9DINO|nr:unnamed protein product [Effrenium voratum]
MKRPAGAGKEPPPKKPRELPPIGKVAEEDKHVFISLQNYSEKIEKLFEGDHDFVFIRGGVAIGKTTLAEHLAARFPDKYVNVPFTEHGNADAWRASAVEAVQKETGRVDGDGSAFRNALRRAKEKNLTLIYDEAHTIFRSPDLCSDLFKTSRHYRPRVLLFSASGDASTASNLIQATPNETSRKFMWTPPLPLIPGLKAQLKDSGVKLDEKSIKFLALFCGGHRGIFMAAMHWVKGKQNGDSWEFKRTVELVRSSYGNGDWVTDTEILAWVRQSRAVRVNGRYSSVGNTPQEFAELLCKGPSRIATAEVRRELAIHGFVLPKHDTCIEEEFQQLDWNNAHMIYQVANPLLASYYRFVLAKICALEVQFESSNPQHCADLLLRALPYAFFAEVVCSSLSKKLLPHEVQYNQCFQAMWKKLNYRDLQFHSSSAGEGKPDCVVRIEKETFVLEGVMHAHGQKKIKEHLLRFKNMANYKNANHQGLYIIGNDSDKMLETLKNTEAGKVQLIGLVPNIAHTAYTVHVKSKGIERINTCNVDCDLVARRLVLKDDGKPELHSVQSLKSINLSPKAETSQPAKTEMVWVRELKEENGEYKLVGNALPIKPAPENIGFLKEVITEKEKLATAASKLRIVHLTEGTWQEEEKMRAALRPSTEETPYGYLVP